MLFACTWSEEFEAELADWYSGDMIEAFMEAEDQHDPWSFGWEGFMARIAPVQLTDGWDVHPYLIETFARMRVEPAYRLGYLDETDNVVFFARAPGGFESPNIGAAPIGLAADVARFHEVLEATIDLASSQGSGLLFVGESGWAYDMDVPMAARGTLERAGFRFATRHA